jgi:pSer/pThr/pTyr-binding forkhead associated (FHA) protein
MLDDLEASLVDAFRKTGKMLISEATARRLQDVQRLMREYPAPETPGAYVLVVPPEALPQWVELRSPHRIGRAQEMELCLRHPWISGHHCSFVCDDDDWLVSDHDSQNGLRVNGERVERHFLKTGDMVQLGVHRLIFVRIEEAPCPTT